MGDWYAWSLFGVISRKLLDSGFASAITPAENVDRVSVALRNVGISGRDFALTVTYAPVGKPPITKEARRAIRLVFSDAKVPEGASSWPPENNATLPRGAVRALVDALVSDLIRELQDARQP